MKIIELDINAFSKAGFGIGSFKNGEGHVASVEVPFTMPGDSVSAIVLSKRKGLCQSRLDFVINPSPDRVQPVCLHFGTCGGCRWQHIAYESQLAIKEQWIRESFKTLISDSTKIYPPVPCLPPWRYRNKMEFTFSSDKAGNRYLGLILQGSRGKVFNMEECHLTQEWFIHGVKAVSKWWGESGLDAYQLNKNLGSLRTLIMREGQRTGDRLVMLTVSGNPDFALNKKQLNDFQTALRLAIEPENSEQKLSIFLRIQQIAKNTPTQFYELLLYGPDHIREILYVESAPEGLTFKISPSAFFQPNTRQAELLYSRALELAKIPENAVIYDLYCGTGTLGICAAKRAKKVIGIELSPEAVLDARENVKNNGLNNIEIIAGDVGKVLTELIAENKGRPDVVMVDPPRAGLDPKAIKNLLEIKAPTLLYISCNPSTQVTNVQELINGGYRLDVVQPVDQFPQTIHVENIAVLSFPCTTPSI